MIGAVTFLVSPLLGTIFGIVVRRMLAPSRRIIFAAGVFMVFAAGGVIVASASYPGPAVTYVAGSIGWFARQLIAAPGIWLLVGIPFVVALVGAAVAQSKSRVTWMMLIAAYGSMPPLILLLLFNGCNYAGACL